MHLVISSRELAENCCIPNAGFLEDVVFEDPALYSASPASESFEDNSSAGHMTAMTHESTEDASRADGAAPISDSVPGTDHSVVNEIGEQVNSAMADLQVAENASGSDSNVDDQHPLSVEDVDSLLDKCLLQALHTTIKDKDLPMLGSILW